MSMASLLMRSPATWLARSVLDWLSCSDDLDGMVLASHRRPDRPWRTRSSGRGTTCRYAEGGKLARDGADEADLDRSTGLGARAHAGRGLAARPSCRLPAAVVVVAAAAEVVVVSSPPQAAIRPPRPPRRPELRLRYRPSSGTHDGLSCCRASRLPLTLVCVRGRACQACSHPVKQNRDSRFARQEKRTRIIIFLSHLPDKRAL